jgi:molecular chaperone Hsp33
MLGHKDSMRVHRFVSNDFTVRAAAVDATKAVIEMQTLQKSLPLATIAVGRAMVGALLMASHQKENQEVGILLSGNGPLVSVYAQASFEGLVRGYCPNPEYFTGEAKDQTNLKKAMGNGFLTVTKQQPFQRQPYTGTVELVSGEVGEDLAFYLHQSHQIRSVVNLGVYLDSYGRVQAAGGLLVEVMPGVEDEVVETIENNAKNQTQSVSELIQKGGDVIQLVSKYLEKIKFTEIPHDFPIKYSCPCTAARVIRAMSLLSFKDLDEMIEEAKVTEVGCQMCGKVYSISVQELKELRLQLHKNSLN